MSTAQLTPACRLAVGARVYDTRDGLASTVLELDVALGLDIPADAVTAVLAGVGSAVPALGDTVSLRLGYAGADLVPVFSGTVTRVEAHPHGIRLTAHGAAAGLLATRVDRTYTSVTAADVVRDLAGQGGVRVNRAEAGGSFPAYTVDSRRSAYHHAHDLADLCDLSLYVEPDGGLVLERFGAGRTEHGYRYGEHLIRVEPWHRPASVASVQAWGESPGTGRGTQAWAWLVKDFRSSMGEAASAGAAGPRLLLERPALRTAELARTAAQAELRRVRGRARGARLLGVGRPEVALGDAVRLSGVGDAADGRYQVRAVRHRLGKQRGFTTAVEAREAT